MSICCNEIISWIDTASPTATTEVEHRMICGRAYYAAYHACKTSFNVTPTNGAGEYGVHKRYITALLTDSDKSVRAAGRKLDLLRLKRVTADYYLNDEFSRRDMSESILWSKKILELAKK